jgi:hypothetical protein
MLQTITTIMPIHTTIKKCQIDEVVYIVEKLEECTETGRPYYIHSKKITPFVVSELNDWCNVITVDNTDEYSVFTHDTSDQTYRKMLKSMSKE